MATVPQRAPVTAIALALAVVASARRDQASAAAARDCLGHKAVESSLAASAVARDDEQEHRCRRPLRDEGDSDARYLVADRTL
jgi:hypothetical protein